ncbi:NACHT domain-containing protein [Streptomyces sp. NPDC048504]|uniref:NACHT domain-containing protein n=1 Tax=Streptomyces sp. NPDC048504 TaxID=3365559 RepID=UPI003723D99F
MSATREVDASWSEMREAAEAWLETITASERPFDIGIAWAASYDDLLSGHWSFTTPHTGLTDYALKRGRVLVSAEAGSGKTHLLARAGAYAARSGTALPVWVPLRDIPALAPKASTESYIRAIISLSKPALNTVLSRTRRVPSVLILADGLNEIPKDLSQLAIDALDELARRYPFLSVIVTERLARRALPLNRWSLATVLPLSPAQIRAVWESTHRENPSEDALKLLQNPFFLDKATLFKPSDSSNRARIIASYFSGLAGVTADVIDQLSEVSFKSYAHDRGMLVPQKMFKAGVDSSAIEALAASEMIRQSENFVWFSHHLFHDYLASRYLVQRKAIWNRDSFDTVTTGAASFDALRLAVEQIGDPVLADEFVREIYDWNYFGAAYALVPKRVTSEMRVELLAMLADKRWDSVSATAQQVTDALRLDGTETSQKMLAAESRADLFRIVNEVSSNNESFSRWKTVFTIPDGELVDENIVANLRSGDPMEAWTLANVLRRCRLHKSGLAELLKIAQSDSAVERWRAVHVLGFHPKIETEAVVERLLDDEDRWVRYGAVRALVEIAAKTTDLRMRERIVARLIDRLNEGSLDDKTLSELYRALDVSQQPAGWPDAVAPLMQQLSSTSANSMEYERWSALMARIATRGEER